jgi:hypothetical protein
MLKARLPSLPVYYHTSAHQRFYKGAVLYFSQGHKEKKYEFLRELLVGNIHGCDSIAQRAATSIRAHFHKPVELPPPPSTVTPLSVDHSYV